MSAAECEAELIRAKADVAHHLRPEPSPAVFKNLSRIEPRKAADFLDPKSANRVFIIQLSSELAMVSPCCGEIVEADRTGRL